MCKEEVRKQKEEDLRACTKTFVFGMFSAENWLRWAGGLPRAWQVFSKALSSLMDEMNVELVE